MLKNKSLIFPMLAVALLGGIGTAAYGIASAQSSAQATNTSATIQTTSTSTDNDVETNDDNNTQKQFDPTKGGHVGKTGIKEEVLTGDPASKATAAALAAIPGGTIERVETDAE